MTGEARIARLPNRTALLVTEAISRIIAKEPGHFRSITFDNGTEFHSYKVLEERFPITC